MGSSISSAHELRQKPVPGEMLLADVACATSATCRLRSLMANKCNFGREALQQTYQGLNLAAHTMGVLITLLCGCLYVNTAAFCALQSVPPVCVFPYNVYSKIFTQTIQLWESVKTATKTCMLHGDPMISS